jgi:hypothetical protein
VARGGGEDDREQLERADVVVREGVRLARHDLELPDRRVAVSQRHRHHGTNPPLALECRGDMRRRVAGERRSAVAVHPAAEAALDRDPESEILLEEPRRGRVHERVVIEPQDRRALGPCQLLRPRADQLHDGLEVEARGGDVALRLDDAVQARGLLS